MNTEILFLKAIMSFGRESRKTLAIEECSELINALCKEKRGRATDADVITEIADVQIMCEQLALMYGKEEVMLEKARKEARLFQRMRQQGMITAEEV